MVLHKRLPLWLIETPLTIPISFSSALYGLYATVHLLFGSNSQGAGTTIDRALPHPLIALWSLQLLLGGVLMLLARPFELLRTEAVALVFMISGLVIYGGALVSFQPLTHILSILFYFGLAAGFSVRLVVVQAALRASVVARQIRRRGEA